MDRRVPSLVRSESISSGMAPFTQGGESPQLAGARRLAVLKKRRKFWLEVHLWLGLGLGLFLSVFGITGALLVFQSEIDHWLNPALYQATVPAGARLNTLDEIMASAQRVAPPGWQSAGAEVPARPDENYVFGYWMKRPTLAPEQGVSINIAINPYTAEVVGRRVFYHAWNPLKHCFVGFLFKLHYSLLLSEHFDDAGNIVVGFMALFLVVSALAGLILWWPLDGKWKRTLTIKKNSGRVRFNHDLHQTTGFYSLLVLLVVLVSGVYFNLPDQFKWMVERFSALTPEAVAKPAGGKDMTGDPGRIITHAHALYPGGRLSYVSLPDQRTRVFSACFEEVPELRPHVIDTRCLMLDGSSGEVLQVSDSARGSAGDTFMLWQWPLHSGKAFGWTGRILVFLCGLACPLLFTTGVIRWLQKRRAASFAEQRRGRLAGIPHA